MIESHGKRDLNKMRSLRLPSEDPRIEGPPYMKGEKRPPEMVCQRFMPLEHEVEEQTCSCKNNGKRCQNTHVPRVEAGLIKRKPRQQCSLDYLKNPLQMRNKCLENKTSELFEAERMIL